MAPAKKTAIKKTHTQDVGLLRPAKPVEDITEEVTAADVAAARKLLAEVDGTPKDALNVGDEGSWSVKSDKYTVVRRTAIVEPCTCKKCGWNSITINPRRFNGAGGWEDLEGDKFYEGQALDDLYVHESQCPNDRRVQSLRRAAAKQQAIYKHTPA